MITVPSLLFAVLGATALGVGVTAGGFGLAAGVLVAAGCLAAAARYRDHDRSDAVARLHGGALTGVATVLSYKDLGATVRDEPMVEVVMRISVPGRQPYETTVYDVVSLYSANRMTTNAAFRCSVHPTQADDVVVRWEQPVTLDGYSDPQNRLGVHTPVRTDASLSAAALLANGLPATARVVQSSSQGTVAPNGDPILVFVLHVVPDNGSPPFQSLTAQRVPPDQLSRTVTGTPLRVAYDPDNRTRMVAIDWDFPHTDPASGPDPAGSVPGPRSPADGSGTGTAPFVVTSTPRTPG